MAVAASGASSWFRGRSIARAQSPSCVVDIPPPPPPPYPPPLVGPSATSGPIVARRGASPPPAAVQRPKGASPPPSSWQHQVGATLGGNPRATVGTTTLPARATGNYRPETSECYLRAGAIRGQLEAASTAGVHASRGVTMRTTRGVSPTSRHESALKRAASTAQNVPERDGCGSGNRGASPQPAAGFLGVAPLAVPTLARSPGRGVAAQPRQCGCGTSSGSFVRATSPTVLTKATPSLSGVLPISVPVSTISRPMNAAVSSGDLHCAHGAQRTKAFGSLAPSSLAAKPASPGVDAAPMLSHAGQVSRAPSPALRRVSSWAPSRSSWAPPARTSPVIATKKISISPQALRSPRSTAAAQLHVRPCGETPWFAFTAAAEPGAVLSRRVEASDAIASRIAGSVPRTSMRPSADRVDRFTAPHPRLLLQAIRGVFAAVRLPPPPLDPPTLCILVRDFEMQNPDMLDGWQDDAGCCAQCAQHVCALLFELASGESSLVPVAPGQSVPMPALSPDTPVADDWPAVYEPMTEALRVALAAWSGEATGSAHWQLVHKLFERACDKNSHVLSWRAGEVQRFVQGCFAVHGLPSLRCPAAVWYQLLRECGAGLSVCVDEKLAVCFVRHLFRRIVELNSMSPQFAIGVGGAGPLPWAPPLKGDVALGEESHFVKSLIERVQTLQPSEEMREVEAQERTEDISEVTRMISVQTIQSSVATRILSANKALQRMNSGRTSPPPVATLDMSTLAHRLEAAADECAADHARVCAMLQENSCEKQDNSLDAQLMLNPRALEQSPSAILDAALLLSPLENSVSDSARENDLAAVLERQRRGRQAPQLVAVNAGESPSDTGAMLAADDSLLGSSIASLSRWARVGDGSLGSSALCGSLASLKIIASAPGDAPPLPAWAGPLFTVAGPQEASSEATLPNTSSTLETSGADHGVRTENGEERKIRDVPATVINESKKALKVDELIENTTHIENGVGGDLELEPVWVSTPPHVLAWTPRETPRDTARDVFAGVSLRREASLLGGRPSTATSAAPIEDQDDPVAEEELPSSGALVKLLSKPHPVIPPEGDVEESELMRALNRQKRKVEERECSYTGDSVALVKADVPKRAAATPRAANLAMLASPCRRRSFGSSGVNASQGAHISPRESRFHAVDASSFLGLASQPATSSSNPARGFSQTESTSAVGACCMRPSVNGTEALAVSPREQGSCVAPGPRGTHSGDVPELLAVVQTTCANLAEKLRQRTQVVQPDGEAGADCRLSAVRAARELLGEVEAAFLSGAFAANANAGVASVGLVTDAFDAKRALVPGLQMLETEASSQGVGSTPIWFDVSTPKGANRGHAGNLGPFEDTVDGDTTVRSAASSLTYGTRELLGNLQRNSQCMVQDSVGQSGSESARSMCQASAVPSKDVSASMVSSRTLLEEWVEDLRGTDTGPILRTRGAE